MNDDSPGIFEGPGAPSTGPQYLPREPSRGGMRARDWVAMAGVLFAVASGLCALGTYTFRSRAAGEVADAKFAAHSDTQAASEKRVEAWMEKIDKKLERISERLPERADRRPR